MADNNTNNAPDYSAVETRRLERRRPQLMAYFREFSPFSLRDILDDLCTLSSIDAARRSFVYQPAPLPAQAANEYRPWHYSRSQAAMRILLAHVSAQADQQPARHRQPISVLMLGVLVATYGAMRYTTDVNDMLVVILHVQNCN